MIKVVKQGCASFEATCHKCRAVFTYTLDDVSRNYVRGGEGVWCPSCAEWIRHRG